VAALTRDFVGNLDTFLLGHFSATVAVAISAAATSTAPITVTATISDAAAPISTATAPISTAAAAISIIVAVPLCNATLVSPAAVSRSCIGGSNGLAAEDLWRTLSSEKQTQYCSNLLIFFLPTNIQPLFYDDVILCTEE
jgi:hypothetical protein